MTVQDQAPGAAAGVGRLLSAVRRAGRAGLARIGLAPRGGGRPERSMDTEYFERLYTENPDPWNFKSSAYEAAKYAATLAALSRPRYASALEIGCSIGVLTAQLAPRCDRLLALDAAAAPLAEARERNAASAHVEIRQARVPEQWPDGRFDLILISEVLYFFDPSDLRRLAAVTAASLEPGGEVVLVHWTGPNDFPQSGDAAVDGFVAALGPAVRVLRQDRQETYRLDVLQRVAGPTI